MYINRDFAKMSYTTITRLYGCELPAPENYDDNCAGSLGCFLAFERRCRSFAMRTFAVKVCNSLFTATFDLNLIFVI
jgi:hypothetical protein